MPQRTLFLLLGASFLLVSALLIWQNQAGLYTQDVIINGTAVPPVPRLDSDLVSRGKDLYMLKCAACHGTGLEGAPNWKVRLSDGNFPAPPHDDSGHTWHHPDFLLIQIMKDGGASLYEGAMPSFEETLSDADMHAILEFLKSHWNRESREYQWWITNIYPTTIPGP